MLTACAETLPKVANARKRADEIHCITKTSLLQPVPSEPHEKGVGGRHTWGLQAAGGRGGGDFDGLSLHPGAAPYEVDSGCVVL